MLGTLHHLYRKKEENMLWLLICLAASATTVMLQEITIPVGIDGRDTLTQIRVQDELGNYDVGYNENQLTGGASFYREKGYANGTRTGSYGYTTRNGLIRIVTYIADQDGYRAEVLTNEPGVGAGNPSNVTVTKEKEPDPEALAQGPTGTGSAPSNAVQGSTMSAAGSAPSNAVQRSTMSASGSAPSNAVQGSTMSAAESNVVRNYVTAAGMRNLGTAQVMSSSPYVQYQYVI